MKACLVLLLVCTGSAAASPSLELSEPTTPIPREVTENGTSPVYYRLPPQLVTMLARTAVGVQTGAEGKAFTFDAIGGAAVRFGRHSAMGLWIEGGYSYVYGREHLAVLGVGPARRPPGFFTTMFAVIPHVVAGHFNGEGCVGVRTSAIAGFSVYGIELAHQVVFTGSGRVTELHIALTFPSTLGGDE
jgi:hypothetical protein